MGWRCFECEASGDALDLAAYARQGNKMSALSAHGKEDVRDWCRAFLGLGSAPRPKLVSKPSLPPPGESEPTYPPSHEVASLWEACERVDQSPAVGEWLRSKGIDPLTLADMDLARALPSGCRLPSWAALGRRSWLDSGHLLVVPMVDANGDVRSLLARRVVDAEGGPKSVAAAGHQRAGLVLACGLARQLLATGTAPEWWNDAPLRIEVCEGEKKFLMRASRHGEP